MAILLVEDSDEDARLIERDFKQVGLNAPIHRVRDAQQAMAYCQGEINPADLDIHGLPEAILLDIKLPNEEDGFTLLRWIKKQPHLSRVAVILVTGIDVVKT